MSTGIRRYRKRPVEVETLEWTGANLEAIRAFAGNENLSRPGGAGDLSVWNEQEYDWITVPFGHSIVKGKLGELYPISPEAIAATYEPVDGEVA
jgi:hypothetical protein